MRRNGALLLTTLLLLAWVGGPGDRGATDDVLVLGAAPPATDAGSFDALTYNVAGLPFGLSAARPGRCAPFIGRKLRGYDLVLLQEDFSFHEELTAGADHAFRSRPQSEYRTVFSDGLNVLSRIPIQTLQRVRWQEAHGVIDSYHDEWAAKGFSVSVCELTPGVVFDVYNLHADAGCGAGDLAARRRAFVQLAKHIVDHSAGRAVLVGGDFNLCWSSAEEQHAFRRLLRDTDLCDVANHLGAPDSSIDRFLFRSGRVVELEPLEIRVADEFVDEQGAPLSDHPALRARFRWRLRTTR